jgi:hypothetical protein
VPSAQFYRDRATQIRRLIDGLRDPDMQKQLAVIAKEYEDMAETLEQPAADKSDRK